MKRAFLDALYKQLFEAQAHVAELRSQTDFPEDGYSVKVHNCRLALAVREVNTLNELIDHYLETHR